MAYHKRTIRNGSIQIDGNEITVAEIDDNISVVWIRAWYRTEGEMIKVGSGQLPLSQCDRVFKKSLGEEQ